MTTNANAGRTLQMRRLISSVWLVLRKNFLLILMLSVALKFVTSNLASFLESEWLIAVIELINTNFAAKDTVTIVIGYLQWMLYWMLLTIFITNTSFDTLNNSKRGAGVLASFDHTLQHMKSLYTAAGIRVLLRCIGVMAVTYVGLLIIPIISFLLVWLFDLSIGSLMVIGAIIWILSFLALGFLTVRWSMAMPEVIIRKANVLESLTGSWRLTRRIWIKMLAISFLFSLFIFLITLIVLIAILAIMYLQDANLMLPLYIAKALPIINPIFEIMWISIMAIWISAQYYVITNKD